MNCVEVQTKSSTTLHVVNIAGELVSVLPLSLSTELMKVTIEIESREKTDLSYCNINSH